METNQPGSTDMLICSMTSAWARAVAKPANTNTPPTSTRNSSRYQGSVQRCPHLRRCTRRLLAWTLDTVQLLANKAHEFVLWSEPDDTLFIDEQRRCTVSPADCWL